MSGTYHPDRPPICLVAGTAEVGPVLGLAGALAVAFARRSNRGVVLADLIEGARRRQPTLLASAASRKIEERLRSAGLDAAARGHICLSALGVDDRDRTLALLEAIGEDALVVCHSSATTAGEWLEGGSPPVGGLLLAADLPREGSLAALVHDSVRQRGVVVRIQSGGIGPLATRRALAGVPPGGRVEARVGRFATALGRGLGAFDQAPLNAAGGLDANPR